MAWVLHRVLRFLRALRPSRSIKPRTAWMLVPLVALSACQDAVPARRDPCASVSAATCATYQALGRGINLGNMLEAPWEGKWGLRFKPEHARLLRETGFTHVRVPVRWSAYADVDAEARLDEGFASRVDFVIDSLLAEGLYVILDMHHYRQLDGDGLDDGERAVAPHLVKTRAVAIWRQLARRYAARSARLLFELYNEPHGALRAGAWNGLAPRLLAAVRESNPNRTVLIGPSEWYAAPGLVSLKPPRDRDVIITIHCYEPFAFTHQGAWGSRWPAGSVDCCSASQVQEVRDHLDTARQWSLRHGLPVYVGEFGSHVSASPDARLKHLKLVREEVEARGMPWALWTLAADFGIFDPETGRWDQALLDALLH